ncbi:MAG: regulator of sigma protease, partial [Patescibacteria group bacterium]|nr:regulator of sigma protease [Patescibacteria group bacterium]
MWLLILGLFLFFMLVVLHEYGHFLVAKRNGVDVEEFGVGFPPKLFGKTFGKGIFKSYYTVNLLPLGGFVRLKGENDAATEKGSLGAASTNVKLRIMLAGVAVNFVAALIFFTIVAWVGMPQIVPNQFTVASDSKVIRQD